MAGYDIDGIEPGAGAGGGGGIPPGGEAIPAADDTLYPTDRLFGWSLQNAFAGLTTLYLRFGSDATATPYIAVNLAENETVTQVFPDGIPSSDGFFLTVEAGAVDGLIYTG
jgi:hypothetical protein